MQHAVQGMVSPILKVLVYRMGNQEFCIDIMRVREIRGWSQATPLPHAPSYVLGVVNLRGTVLPIIDFARLLGFAPLEPTSRSAIIVIEHARVLFGLLVDGVSEVLDLNENLIQTTPPIAADTSKMFVAGVAAIDHRMISVVSLDAITPRSKEVALA